jgi:LuxR family maltose regulon positive regulatory protein
LVLVTAPAGYGKTTLLAKWIEQAGLPATWLSLDSRDNDPTSFWLYFIAALQNLQSSACNNSLGLLQAAVSPPQEALLGTLLNEISLISSEFLFILDDFHTINSPEILAGLAYLIERQPPQMHLVIASRDDPSLPLPRLRARREMVEVHLADLRFTFQEATTLFRTLLKMDLPPADIEALDNATEGWAAGLQLAAISMQGIEDASGFIRSFTGSQRYIFDYLAQEVLERQEAGIQNFLLQTSILDRLSGPLCNFLLMDETEAGSATSTYNRSDGILEYLERVNLFLIPLDQDRLWYRYHHLFAEFLQANLEQKKGAPSIFALHHRASIWFQEYGFLAEAIDHALHAKEYARAAALIDQAAENMFQRSELVTLRNWLSALPSDQLRQEARLSVVFAWVLLATGQFPEMDPYLENAERLLGLQAGDSLENKSLPAGIEIALGEIACLRSALAINRFDLEEALYQGQQAQAYLAGKSGEGLFNDTESLRGIVPFNLAIVHELIGEVSQASHEFEESIALSKENFHLLPMAYTHLAYLMIIQGKLRQAEKTYRQAFQVAEMSPIPSPLSGVAHTGMGNLLVEWNYLDQAETELQRGIQLGQKWANHDAEISGYTGLIRSRFATGDHHGAQELIDELGNLIVNHQVAWSGALIEGLQARVWIQQKQQESLQAWAARKALELEGQVPYMLEDQAIVLARAHITLGQFQPALSLIERVLPATEAGSRWGRAIELRLLLSLALFLLEKSSLAFKSLESALELAEAEGYLRLFLDEGEPMERLLTTYAHQPTARFRDYASSLLLAFKVEKKSIPTGSPNQPPTGSSELIEPLSERELEVLRLLASGLSNQEISARLVVSQNTVKSHIKNIYGKLGVNSRTQAIARSRAAGLIQ